MALIKPIIKAILSGIFEAIWKYMLLQRRIQDRKESIDELIVAHHELMEELIQNKELSDEEKDARMLESARRIVYGT